MSNIKNLMFDIMDMLEENISPEQVATKLNVPIEWVLETSKYLPVAEIQQDFDPYNTVNS